MKILSKLILIIVILTVVTGGAMAASDVCAPSVRAFVDKKTIFIGDRIRYTIEVKSKKGFGFLFPVPKAEGDEAAKLGGFEVRDTGSSIKKGIFGGYAISKWYIITSYSTGKHVIPELEVKYRQKGKKSPKDFAVIKTKPVTITVVSILPKGQPIKDIKDIKGPISFFEINWILVSILTVLIVFVLLFIWHRKKKPVPVKLPHETALEELEALKALLARTGDIKEYYVGVSDCVRHYIEKAFALKAPEMTTEEFLNSLKDSRALSAEQKDLLKEFLRSCDLVKFAKYAPTSAETESVYLSAKKFIEETKDVHI